MSTAAIGLMVAGFLFTFYSIPVAGVDILIDAVGYLLLFNAAGALKKLGERRHFKLAPALSFLLVLYSAVQMFLYGGTAVLAGVPRALLELLLFLSLGRGFGRQLVEDNERLMVPAVLCRAVFPVTGLALLIAAVLPCANLFGDIISPAGMLWGQFFMSVVLNILYIVILLLLVVVWVMVALLHAPVPPRFLSREPAPKAQAEPVMNTSPLTHDTAFSTMQTGPVDLNTRRPLEDLSGPPGSMAPPTEPPAEEVPAAEVEGKPAPPPEAGAEPQQAEVTEGPTEPEAE